MKYKYIPNCHIIDYKTNREKFCFDENGFFETDDPKLIEWIRKNKNFLKPVGEEAKEEKKESKKLPADGLYNCKKCNFATTNKGELLAHYRNEHKKDDE